MLSLWILSILLLGGSASPLTDQALISDEALEEVVALEEVEEALEEVESRERALEQQLLATLLEEERLLDTEVAGAESGKFIGTNAEGEQRGTVYCLKVLPFLPSEYPSLDGMTNSFMMNPSLIIPQSPLDIQIQSCTWQNIIGDLKKVDLAKT